MSASQPSFDWDELLLCISERRVIPIVGKELITLRLESGEVSLERYVAERLATSLAVPPDQLSSDLTLNEVALRYLESGGDGRKIYSRVKAILAEQPLPVPEALRKLAAITDFRLYVSLSFDTLLEEAINRERFAGEPRARRLVYSTYRQIEDLPSELEKLDSPLVYHLFGVASTATDYAVTDEDVLEFLHSLQSESRRPQTLFDEFRDNHLLFVGCGYENWLERFVIRCIANERLTETRRTAEFVADERARSDARLTFFLTHYRTEVFLSGSPAEFVDALYERWLEQHPSAPIRGGDGREAAAPRMETGGIFLSYASEDREAVRNMKEALEKVGMEVWFDQGDLRPGDAWDRQIQANIRRCAVFLPFVSRQAQRRLEGYFRREWKWAIDRDQGMDESLRFIQPVVLDDIPEGAEHVPGYFWTRHCSRFPEGRPDAEFVEQLRQLVRNLRLKGAGN